MHVRTTLFNFAQRAIHVVHAGLNRNADGRQYDTVDIGRSTADPERSLARANYPARLVVEHRNAIQRGAGLNARILLPGHAAIDTVKYGARVTGRPAFEIV